LKADYEVWFPTFKTLSRYGPTFHINWEFALTFILFFSYQEEKFRNEDLQVRLFLLQKQLDQKSKELEDQYQIVSQLQKYVTKHLLEMHNNFTSIHLTNVN
jgi:hypothetical protein